MPKLKRQYDVHISLATQQKGFHHAVFCDKILAHLNLHFSFFIMFMCQKLLDAFWKLTNDEASESTKVIGRK